VSIRPNQIKLRRREYFRRRRSPLRWLARITVLAMIGAGGYWGYERFVNRAEPAPQKMVVIGFDGADLDFIHEYWDALPNLRRLAEWGSLSPLRTVCPPESPVTWSSFASGAGPGVHGVFGSVYRPWGTYLISPRSTYGWEDPKFVWGLIRTRGTRYYSKQQSPTFWDILAEHKIPSVLIRMPGLYPPPEDSSITCLSGDGMTDLMDGRVAYFHLSPAYEEGTESTFMGGRLVPLRKENEWYRAEIGGFWNPVVQDKITRLRGKRHALAMKRVENRVLLWLLERAAGSRTAETDRDELRRSLGRVGQDLRTDSRSAQKKLLPEWRRLRSIVDDPDGPEAVDWLADENHPAPDELRKTIRDQREEENNLLKEQRALEEKPGVPPSITKPIALRVTDETSVLIDFEDTQPMIFLGEWSNWFKVTYPITPFSRVHGLTRFYLQSVDPELNVFMHSIIVDPRDPSRPLSHPSAYASELAEELGPFDTRGHAAKTAALLDEKLDEKAFMEDVLDTLRLREAMTLSSLENQEYSLFVSVFSAADHVATVMGRHADPLHPLYDPQEATTFKDTLKQIYIQMDALVGKVLAQLDVNTVLFVVSDRGSRPVRHTVNLNNRLIQQGYMTLKEDDGEPPTMERLMSGRLFIESVDWSQTRAYSLGYGQVYINLQGREPEGIVQPSDYERLCAEIRQDLLGLRDTRPGRSGEQVVSWVGIGKDLWSGSAMGDESDAPDLVVGFAEGYGASLENVVGAAGGNVIEENRRKRSADSSGAPVDQVPGFVFCNRPISYEDPSILDLAPTILHYFDLPVSQDMQGRDLLGPAIRQDVPTITPTPLTVQPSATAEITTNPLPSGVGGGTPELEGGDTETEGSDTPRNESGDATRGIPSGTGETEGASTLVSEDESTPTPAGPALPTPTPFF